VTTVQRWMRWLDDRGGIERHPLAAVWASILAGRTGRPVEAERWADAVDRWQSGDATRPDDPAAEAWAAILRAMLCRRGAEQMRADADDAARKLAAAGIVAPAAALFQGVACVLCGEPEAGDQFFADAIAGGEVAAPDVLAIVLFERSLLAMARGDWGLAEDLAGQSSAVLRRAGIEDSYVTPLVCAARARAAWHRGDAVVARQQLVGAQRLRPVLTYAIPYLAARTARYRRRPCP
jgi:LuxR family transcriptional regulator, maltose regulon positive regulatory protein